MIYLIAVVVPPLGLLLNGQPLTAAFNLALIVPCFLLGFVFHALLLVPSLHAVIAVHMKREERRHREIVEAIERRVRGPDGSVEALSTAMSSPVSPSWLNLRDQMWNQA